MFALTLLWLKMKIFMEDSLAQRKPVVGTQCFTFDGRNDSKFLCVPVQNVSGVLLSFAVLMFSVHLCENFPL